MGKFEGILICTDLDGTLLSSDKKISKENLDAIEYFKANGGYFTFITGRMPFYAQFVYQTINPNCPFGCNNGGALYDHRRQEYIWRLELDETALKLADEVSKQLPEIGWHIAAFEHTYFCVDTPYMEGFRQRANVAHLTRGDRPDREPMAKIAFCDQDFQLVSQAKERIDAHPLAGHFEMIRSEDSIYEIMPIGANKGTAFKKLTELLKLDPQNTIAIGDYNNDVKMLEAAGCGVAVANASPEAKAVADYITVSNDEHAIAAVINALERGELKKGTHTD